MIDPAEATAAATTMATAATTTMATAATSTVEAFEDVFSPTIADHFLATIRSLN